MMYADTNRHSSTQIDKSQKITRYIKIAVPSSLTGLVWMMSFEHQTGSRWPDVLLRPSACHHMHVGREHAAQGMLEVVQALLFFLEGGVVMTAAIPINTTLCMFCR